MTASLVPLHSRGGSILRRTMNVRQLSMIIRAAESLANPMNLEIRLIVIRVIDDFILIHDAINDDSSDLYVVEFELPDT